MQQIVRSKMRLLLRGLSEFSQQNSRNHIRTAEAYLLRMHMVRKFTLFGRFGKYRFVDRK